MNSDRNGSIAVSEKPMLGVQNPDTMLSIATGAQATSFKRLALDEYGARKWVSPDEYPDGILTDRFDKESDVLTICTNGECVAGTRVVRYSNLGFPHEGELKLDLLKDNPLLDPEVKRILRTTPIQECAEVTRVVGKRRVKKLTLDIIKCLYWYAKGRRISVYLMVIDLGFFTLCTEHNGIPIVPIGIPTYCEGSWTIPALTGPGKWPELIATANPIGWEHISDESNLDHTWSLH